MGRRGKIAAVALTVLLGLTACSSGDGAAPTASAPGPTTSASSPAPDTSASVTSASSTAPPTTARRTVTVDPTSSTPSTTARRPAPTPPRPVARGTVVVLNPGHNGGNAGAAAEINRQVPAGYGERKACDTTGTETNDGYSEHAFTWDVAKRVRRGLEAVGVTVVMTRSNDDGVGPCVDERAAIGNRADVAASVSIHADGAASSGHGFHVNQASRRPDGASKQVASDSRALGRAIHRTLVASSGLTPSTYIGSDGYYYRSDLAGLNLATRPTTFLELGNMRNAGDAALLSSAAGRARIASAITDGILTYLR